LAGTAGSPPKALLSVGCRTDALLRRPGGGLDVPAGSVGTRFPEAHLATSRRVRYQRDNGRNTSKEGIGTMAAVCELCGKGPSWGMSVSHSHRRTKRRWNPNIQRVRAVVDGTPKRLYVCTSCIKAGKVVKPTRAPH
jgi:large subunit ribosomal protein L28